jgi:hypothetical protein
VHWARWLSWTSLLNWPPLYRAMLLHRAWLHALQMQLEIRLVLELEATLASVLASISLSRGRRLLDLTVLGVHVWLRWSRAPEVGELAHRVLLRKIMNSERASPGRNG